MRKLILIMLALASVILATTAEARGKRFWHGSRKELRYEFVYPHFKRGDFIPVLNYCRAHYGFANPVDMNAQFLRRWGQTDWFCVFRG